MISRNRALGVVAGLGAVLAVVALVLGVLEIDEQRRTHDADASASSIAGTVAADLATGAAGAEHRLETLASSITDRPSVVLVAQAVPGFSSVGVVEGDARTVMEGALSTEILRSDGFAAASAKARDSGVGQLSGPVGTPPRPALVLPLYAVGEAWSEQPPVESTESRRETIGAFLVGEIDVEQFLDPTVVTEGSVEIADEGSTLASSGPAESGRRRTVDVDIDGRRWVVTSVVGPSSGPGALAVLLTLAVVAVAAQAGVIGIRQRTARRSTEWQLDRERQRRGVIADLAPLLQRSLHLSDVLPALAVQLADRFDLEGVSIVAPGEGGGSHELFCHGRRPAQTALADVGLSGPLAAGKPALLTLTRGGRIIAELRFSSRRDLDERDVEGIHTSAELVTSAIVTAQAIDRQMVAMDRLSELDSLKNVFLTTAAHELKTPLAAIMGLADVLDGHWDRLGEDERRTMARRVADNASALDHLVTDLLDFSRLETGELTVDRRPLHLEEIVRSVLDRQGTAWTGHTIAVDAEDGPPIAADPLALERVLTNLVANAVKYSEAGTTVSVSVRHAQGHADLIVDDQGPGIDAADRERVFERFYRGTGDAVLRTRGVGVGLSVVREFVRKLDGTIEVADSPIGGARFRCRFPHHELTSASAPSAVASAEG